MSDEIVSRPANNKTKIEAKTLCFISPCLNESENIELLYNKLIEVANNIKNSYDIDYRIVFIDDGSTDNTWEMLDQISSKNPKVKSLKLSRNFGKENALLAGFENAPKCDYYVTLDADLQDDPAVISRMIESANQGYEIVYAQRATRKDSYLYVLCTKIFYKIMQLGSKVKFPPNVSDFYLITDKVRKALLQMQESVRYTRGLVFYTGFSKIGVQYDRPNRNAGKSKFNFIKLTIFMFDAITSFTSLPVHIISLIGLLLSVVSFVAGLSYILLNVFSGNVFPGWGSLMAVAIFLGSVQILMIGVVAEYIARMNIELKRRPKYFLAEVVNE